MLNRRTTGSAAISRVAQLNPLEVLKGLTEDHPTADANKLFSYWLNVVRDDEELLVPALRHTFTNMLSALDRDKRNERRQAIAVSVNTEPQEAPKPPAEAVTRSAQVAAKKDEVKQRVKAQILQIALMNLTLPNGKLLRDSTFKECAKAGGWFAKVAKMGKPDQVIGRTLSEQDLRSISQ